MQNETDGLPFCEELIAHARGLAWGSSRDRHEREDFLQEILIVYLSLATHYTGLPENEFIMLAKTSARNRIRDIIRKKCVRSDQMTVAEMPDPGFEDEETVELEDVVDYVYRRVGPRAKAVLAMHRDGLDSSEVRDLLGLSYSAYFRDLQEIRRSAPEINPPRKDQAS